MNADEFKKEFGRQVRSLRKKQGLSVHRLSIRIGCAPEYLRDVETGRACVRLTDVQEITRGLGVSPTDLIEAVER